MASREAACCFCRKACWMINIYVGNLPFTATEDEVREAFAAYGEVLSVKLINDRETGRPRGFGFVEMKSKDEGTAAIAGLNGTNMGGRPLRINEAKPREQRPRRPHFGGPEGRF